MLYKKQIVSMKQGKSAYILTYSLRLRRHLSGLLMLLVGVNPVYALDLNALPNGGSVAVGTAAMVQNDNRLDINQSSQNASLNWDSFNIGANAQVNFHQPSASSVALNRVAAGAGASEIFGQLNANGQVFLLNPSGVLFSHNAQVNVGGLVASTMSLSDADFLAGKYTFLRNGSTAAVINQGMLTAAEGGYIALLAPEVRNEGTITARLGTVALGAGERITLDFFGDRLVNLAVDQSALRALVENRHLIQADGGTVILAARAEGDLAATVVNNAGVIRAQSIASVNGAIRLGGGNEGIVSVSGTLDASGRNAGETGGSIQVLGDKVGLFTGANLDASGDAGGGTVLVGGDFQGRPVLSSAEGNAAIQNATFTYVDQNAIINADALTYGNGGRVIVWADNTTRFYGQTSARGGQNGGDGGFVEVSGKKWLDFSGAVDTSALLGAAGMLLLDPTDITISTGATANGTCPAAGPCFALTGNPATAVLNITTLLNALANTNVTVNTTSTAGNTGNITVADPIAYTGASARTLTLTAEGGISFDGNPSPGNITSAAAALTLTLNAATTITNLRNVDLFGGVLTLNATGNAMQAGVISGTTSVVKNGAGTFTLSSNNTYTGTTTINAGTVTLENSNKLADGSSIVVNGGTFDINTKNETVTGVQLLSGSITGTTGTLTSTTAYDMQVGSVSAKLDGAVGLTKTNAGTVTLSGANTYTGATTISAGILALGATNAVGPSSAVTVASGATFNLNGFSDMIGSLAGAGTVTSGAAGAVTLTAGGNTTTTTFSGILQDGSGTLALTKAGAGTLTFSGANTYSGATTASAGTLATGNNAAFGTGTLVLNGGTVAASGGSRTLSNAVSLAASSTVGGANDLTFTNTLTNTLAGNPTLTVNNSGTTTFGAINLSNSATNRTLTFAGTGNAVVSGVIANGGTATASALTKAGTGTLTLSGANTYTGATTVSAGVVRVQNNTALGTTGGGVTVDDGAALELQGSITVGAEALSIRGTGAVGTGALLNVSGDNTWGGAITLGVGGARINSDSGTFTLSGAIGGNARPLTAGGAGNTTISGVIGTASGTLTKDGTGTLTLSGANTYTGATTVSAGVVRVQNNTALGTTGGGVTVDDGAALELQSGVIIGAEALTLNSDGIGGAGALRNLANNTWSGAITLGVGGARINSDSGTLTLSGAISGNARPLTAGGAGNTTISGVIGTASGTLTKDGAGTLTLSGTNLYTGLTNITAGTLAYGASNVINTGAVMVDGDTAVLALGLNQSDSVGTVTVATGGRITGTGTSTLTSTGTFEMQAGAVSAILAGNGIALNKTTSGTMTLSGTNTYTGATTINAGVLSVATIGDGGVTGNLGAATTAAANLVLGGGTLQYTGATASTNRNFILTAGTTSSIDVTTAATNLTMAGASTNTTGALTKLGAGMLTFAGANLYTGLTTVGAGTLVAANTAALGSTASGTMVASGATLQIANVAIGNEAVTLNGTGVGAGGALTGTGLASLAGFVTLASASSIGAAAGNTLALGSVISGAYAINVVGGGSVIVFNGSAPTVSVAAAITTVATQASSGLSQFLPSVINETTGSDVFDKRRLPPLVAGLASPGTTTR